MKLHRIIFIVGLLIVINSFLGIPSDYKDIIYIVLGSLLVIIGIALKFKKMNQENLSKNVAANKTFVETVPSDVQSATLNSQSEISIDEQKI